MAFPLLGVLFAGIKAAGAVAGHIDRTNRANQHKKFVNLGFDREIEEVNRTLRKINDSTRAILAARGVGGATTEALVFENFSNAQRDIDTLNIKRSQALQNADDFVAESGFKMFENLTSVGGGLASGLTGLSAKGSSALNFGARSPSQSDFGLAHYRTNIIRSGFSGRRYG